TVFSGKTPWSTVGNAIGSTARETGCFVPLGRRAALVSEQDTVRPGPAVRYTPYVPQRNSPACCTNYKASTTLDFSENTPFIAAAPSASHFFLYSVNSFMALRPPLDSLSPTRNF